MWHVIRCIGMICCTIAGLLAGPAEARRVALVIGNAAYKVGPLQNPVSDAAAVAEAFDKQLRFDKVILKRNLGSNGFRAALQEMAREASGADLGVVYFAGHGTELNGRNYLIPVDAVLAMAGDLDLEAIALDTVLKQLAGVKKLKLVILDACRNNLFPMAGVERAGSRGLARFEPNVNNTVIAYAASYGTTAADGAGRRHSPFTEALLKHIATPALEIRFLFGEVRDEVAAATGGDQQPHVYYSLGRERFFLLPPAPERAKKPPPSDAAETARICRDVEGMSDLSSLGILANQNKGQPAARCIEARIQRLTPPPEAKAKPIEPPRPRVEDVLAQAQDRIASGDVAGAREILLSSESIAPGPIALALAETYDPNMLAAWGTRGITADAIRAKSLYRKAHGLNVPSAKRRLDNLELPEFLGLKGIAAGTVYADINVAPAILGEPASQVALSIRVGPSAALPTNAFVRLRGLPASVSLSEGHAIAPGSWAVPLFGLASLKAIVPAGLWGRTEMVVSLVGLDAGTLAESKTALVIAPPPAPPPVAKPPAERPPKRVSLEPTPVAPRPLPRPRELSADERTRAEQQLARGRRHLEAGNISAARMFFQRAAEAGLADGAISMAGTYDPAELARFDAVITPDRNEARKWYERARELGAPQADELLARLAGVWTIRPETEKQASRLPRVGETFRDCPDCPEMVVVPAGSFMMGSPANETDRESNEDPQHRVTIARPFAVGKFEVTIAEWNVCVAEGGCRRQVKGGARLPVIFVTWHDAKEYVAWLSRKTGKSYRLPSEAEWEYAARAGTTTPYAFGDTISKSQAQYSKDGSFSAGSFPANRFGLHDMHGNVSEWVEDAWHPNYLGAPDDGSVWPGGDTSARILRGGSWTDVPRHLRSAYRLRKEPDWLLINSGFRVARTLNP